MAGKAQFVVTTVTGRETAHEYDIPDDPREAVEFLKRINQLECSVVQSGSMAVQQTDVPGFESLHEQFLRTTPDRNFSCCDSNPGPAVYSNAMC